VPNLPANWITVASSGNARWVTSTTNPDTPTADAYGAASVTAGTTELISPSYVVSPSSMQMTFRNAFNFQATGAVGSDGMVLEISINGTQFQDIIAAGGNFVTGGYNSTISNANGSPIGGRQAWSGLSGGTTAVPAYITTTVNLPPAASNQLVKMRWLVASDNGIVAAGDQGARIDSITGTACPTTAADLSIGGRVQTNTGQGLLNATVTISDNNGFLRNARTSSFGYYRFDEIPQGRTYVLTVNSRLYNFTPQVIYPVDNLTDVDFVGW
jgi:hypothetical protein